MPEEPLTQTEDQLIFTADEVADRLALEELQRLDPSARLERWLAPGIGWVRLDITWDTLARQIRSHPPIFCRHICPMQARVPLQDDEGDLSRLAESMQRLLARMDSSRRFSVQTRLLGEAWSYGPYDVNMRLADQIKARGLSLDVREPQQIVSVVLAEGHGYLGVSLAKDNLSDWAGGERRFRREKGQISRAEFKLLEAIELFDLSFPGHGLVLDLGAAPGGWTRIVRQRGRSVVAVDPADLDARLANDADVHHVRNTAQSYLQQTQTSFDVVLNDMRMDAPESARITLEAMRHLTPQGWALQTLKLPRQQMGRVADTALKLLESHATIIGARQLFHNRSEITVALGHPITLERVSR